MLANKSWVAVGIGLKNFIKKNLFEFANYANAEHGCFMISQDKNSWTFRDKPYNNTSTHGIEFTTGDIVAL